MFISASFAVENFLDPKDNTNFSNGDIGELIINSELTDDELQEFVHKKITSIIYVLEFKLSGDERIFKVVFTPPPKKKSDKVYPFVVRGLNYTFDKDRVAQKFSLFNSEYTPKEERSPYLVVISFFLILLLAVTLGFFLVSYTKLAKIKSRIKKRVRFLTDNFYNASSREDLEGLYKMRKELIEFTDIDEQKWNLFERELNLIQFKKKWSREELNSLLLKKNEIGKVRGKNGI